MRTKLPALDASTRPRVSVEPSVSTNVKPFKCGRSQRRPARLARLEKAPNAFDNQAKERKTKVACSESNPRETSRKTDNQRTGYDPDQQLQQWVSRAKETLERLLRMKQNVNQREIESYDLDMQLGLSRTIASLQSGLDNLSAHSAVDETIREQCQRMLDKISTINRDNERILNFTEAKRCADGGASIKQQIPDAEFAVTGFDGKRMFFKQRMASLMASAAEAPKPEDSIRSTAMIVPHPRTAEASTQMPIFPSDVKQVRLRSGLISRLWSSAAFVGVCRVDGRRVVVRIEEYHQQRALQIVTYSAEHCHQGHTSFPVALLPFIHSQLLLQINGDPQLSAETQLRIAQVLPCLAWSPPGLLDFQLPIRYRQARILSYRTYATFFCLVSIRLGKDFSLGIRLLDAHTSTSLSVSLSSERILLTTGNCTKDWLEMSDPQSRFFPLICNKLYVEYTTRGFELLYPGVKPSGRLQRHPTELAMLQDQEDKLQEERHHLSSIMVTCARQAAGRAIRRLEQPSLRRKQQRLPACAD